MQTFNQHAGTRRRYDFALQTAAGHHPAAASPQWQISRHVALDGSAIEHHLAEIATSVDGLRAVVSAGQHPGRITVRVTTRVTERQTRHDDFEVVIDHAPTVELHATSATFDQQAPGALI